MCYRLTRSRAPRQTTTPPSPPPASTPSTMTLNLQGKTFAGQSSIPKLPIPPLEDTCSRYLRALEGLQDPAEHARTKAVVEEFLKSEGPRLQEKLKAYAADKARCVNRSPDLKGVILADKLHPLAASPSSYIEEFWYESYLSHSDPVVLALNPFFVLE